MYDALNGGEALMGRRRFDAVYKVAAIGDIAGMTPE